MKSCFVIAPIGEDDSLIRKRSDDVLQHVIAPAVKVMGYDEPVRADNNQPGLINQQIIEHLINDDLVIADLTGHNPNVFYELAIRHAFHKPCVQLIKKSENIPFDIFEIRTIQIDEDSLSGAARAQEQIVEQIRYFEQNPDSYRTPITRALVIEKLGQSGNSVQNALAQILESLSDLHFKMNNYTSSKIEKSTELFSAGERISHPKFGQGVVEQIIGEGRRAIYSIKFDQIPSRKLIDPKFTQLQIIKNN